MDQPHLGDLKRPLDLKQHPIVRKLHELALDLRWSWNHAADDIWVRLDPELWSLTRNPWLVLQTIGDDVLLSVLNDQAFCARIDELAQERGDAEKCFCWFQQEYSSPPFNSVAYLSMEFMLSEAMPIYSGGLGNVAGDQLKTASDLGVPIVGIGLLYQQGYFRQEIDATGRQQALYPFNDPGQLPIRPLRADGGAWVRIAVNFPNAVVWARAWKAKVGRTLLYLLDTNDPANHPTHRAITAELYGGGPEMRLRQELVLGIGGWKLLRALGLRPEVCHLNEGHCAFAVLQRALCFMEETKQPFSTALAATRAGNIFTTHTPVAAGFDRFDPYLVGQYFKSYAEQSLGISLDDLLALGRRNREDRSEPFNMAYLAVRCSGHINGVSRLHGKVSREIFQDLFPRWPEMEVPIRHVTNGVHMPSWDSAQSDTLWTKLCGKDRWRQPGEDPESRMRQATDEDLWEMRVRERNTLVTEIRKRLTQQLKGQGAPAEELAVAERMFDANSLTLGFARRFATYKRPNLLLYDQDRLVRILTNAQRPVQLVLAGKAHPQDQAGQEMIENWVAFIWQRHIRPHVCFLSDYDVLLATQLVQGVDVWINTPRRPWEASGTSGMKVLVNGGLNASELDGWWAEAYAPDVGWAIGDGKEHGDDPAFDVADANALYDLLEHQIIPEFYARDERGVPREWLLRVRESMARLTPEFSAGRAVRQYTTDHYVPAAAAYRERAANQGALAQRLVEWERTVTAYWDSLRFGELRIHEDGSEHRFEVPLYLDDITAGDVSVELYADPIGDAQPARIEMTRGAELIGSKNAFLYSASVRADRPADHFTPRLIPSHPGALVPLECNRILWQR